MNYNWAAYYKTEYEKQRKQNLVLATQLADAQKRCEATAAHLSRIQNNTCYKITRPFSKVKNLGKHLKKEKVSTKVCEITNPLFQSYEEQRKAQSNPYGRWIQEIEPNLLEDLPQLLKDKMTDTRVISYEQCAGIRNVSDVQEMRECILIFAKNPRDLDEKALQVIQSYFRIHEQVQILYSHEDQMTSDMERGNPWFKPQWSRNTLLGFFYFGSMFAVRAAAAKDISWLGSRDALENIYDFVLQLTEKHKPALLDYVLYHQSVPEILKIEDYQQEESYFGYEKKYVPIKQASCKRMGFDSEGYQTWQIDTWSVVPRTATEPLVSVVIPNKDYPEVLKTCITSFLEKTRYQNVEFIVVDNGSEPENKRCIETFLSQHSAKYIYHPMEFNFSRMCNMGEAQAKGEYILLLNNDIEILEENWLNILVGQAFLPGTGAVGAKLWYPSKQQIQHVGITNMHIGPSHKLVTYTDDRTYYYGHNTVSYDMIGVTAAALLVKRTIYQQVGGLDESMRVSYNDVDFCFKIEEQGYHNVIRNDAVLIHHESLTRGLDALSEEKWERLLSEKTGLYEKHPAFKNADPYYSEHLCDNDPAYYTGYKYPYERLLETLKPEKAAGKKQLHDLESPAVMLTMERVIKQHKIHLEEPEIYMAEGWCYMLGADNCKYSRMLILECEAEDWYYKVPVFNRYRADVEAILPLQTHIALSGFVCRMLKEDLTSGKYRAGILYQDVETGKAYFQSSDKIIEITR